MRPKRTWHLALAVAALLAGSYAPPDDEEPDRPEEAAAVESEPEESPERPTATPFLPASMRRSTRVETFPHPEHVEISCSVCHERPRGHDSHATVDCAECHRSSALAVRPVVPEAECLSCHHDESRGLSCSNCHAVPGVLTSTQRWALDVWAQPRARTLTFDHTVHEQTDCRSCHVTDVMLETTSCGSCHEEHHRVEASCLSCHTVPEGSHEVESHLGCGGSGCHDSGDWTPLIDARSTCLSCHADLLDHRPGEVCVDCHTVRAETRTGRPDEGRR